MMIFDVEHSCTDTREEQKQNNRLSALPWVGGMIGGGREEVLLLRLSAVLLLLFHLKTFIVSGTGEGKKKRNFLMMFCDLLWFQELRKITASL